MRPHTFALLVLGLLALANPCRLPAADLHHFDDAALHAVQFVDKNEGWAVGDEGAIWHTIDGGKNWERQATGCTASLRSLSFFNPYVGWVVGREELPAGGSAGVLLFTDDGGLKWQRVLLNTLPGLNVVRFVNDKVGFLAGDGSEQHPSGAYFTEDSGQSWKPIPGPRCSSWLAAGITEQCNAVLAGAWNRLATARADRVTALDVDILGGRSLRGMHFLGRRGVAVGQGGLLLISNNPAGSSWRFPEPNVPVDYQANWDFHAVHGTGSHFWVVGRPGSVVLHSKDSGLHWEVLPTQQSLPLNGVFFIDEQTGWAVGELGTILVTADGGKSWRVQKRGGERAAALLLHARPGSVPLETIAHLGAKEGYLTAAVRLTAPDGTTASPARAAEALRFGAAVRQAGGVGGEMLWQFPITSHLARASRDDLIRSWDQLHGERSADQLLRQLVLALRTWRPSVVITDHPDEKTAESTADALVAEAVRTAFEQAGDPKAFPEQITNLGLSPWRVTKVYSLWDEPKTASVRLDLTEACSALGESVQEFAGPAVTLLGNRAPVPGQRCFRHLAGVEGTAGHPTLMHGIDLGHGGLARRPAHPVEEMTPEQTRALRQRSNLRALTQAPNGLAKPEQLLAQLGPMLAEVPDDQAARALHAVAGQYSRMGQWCLARETFVLMLERYPAHPLTADAYRWLLQHNSSSEARRRHEMGQFVVIGQQTFGLQASEAPEPQGIPIGDQPAKPGFQPPKFEQRQARQLAFLTNQAETRQWYQSCLELENKLAAFGPLFTRDPAIQFCLQSARRNLGDFDTPRKGYAQLAASLPEGPWKRAALAELWLLDRTGQPPREVVSCPCVESRPHLDGKLDDACWENAPVVKLVDAGGKTAEQNPTDVRLAFDRQYLYVAVRCFHPSGKSKPLLKPRLHDVDSRDQDRVSLVFDLDRDYATWFHLQVDQRGCVLEDCWGDRTWDPRWFVGLQTEASCWTVELAIPLTVLTGDAVIPGRAWAFNAIRVIPGQGVQAWSLPAEAPEETLRTEGLGLLVFTPGQKQTAAVEPLPQMMPKVK